MIYFSKVPKKISLFWPGSKVIWHKKWFKHKLDGKYVDYWNTNYFACDENIKVPKQMEIFGCSHINEVCVGIMFQH